MPHREVERGDLRPNSRTAPEAPILTASAGTAPTSYPLGGVVSGIESRQVDWWSCHTFIDVMVRQANAGPLPMAGSPSWCELADGDPRKLLALAAAGEHHVLRVETAQHALAETSRDIATAADWPNIAREVQQRNDFYAERPWLRRKGAA
jgi:hypothetical protein